VKLAHLLPFVLAFEIMAQTPQSTNPFQPLAFLEGTWGAKGVGSSGAASDGKYAFVQELRNHLLARHTVSQDSCKGPSTFDCDHSDLLYIYPEGPNQALKAIYFDNEGHVIHYDVSTPSPSSAVFLSDRSLPGPQFRLLYERKGDTMSGKFQVRIPGQSEWKSYLEWVGGKE
jgi:hypothetical protein